MEQTTRLDANKKRSPMNHHEPNISVKPIASSTLKSVGAKDSPKNFVSSFILRAGSACCSIIVPTIEVRDIIEKITTARETDEKYRHTLSTIPVFSLFVSNICSFFILEIISLVLILDDCHGFVMQAGSKHMLMLTKTGSIFNITAIGEGVMRNCINQSLQAPHHPETIR